MEATVTMSLADYDRLKERINDLDRQLKEERVSFDQIIKMKDEIIGGLCNENIILKNDVMKRGLETKELSDIQYSLSENDYYKGILNAFKYYYLDDFKRLNISLDDQREFVREKHTEYQSELEAQELRDEAHEQALNEVKQQEELENGSK